MSLRRHSRLPHVAEAVSGGHPAVSGPILPVIAEFMKEIDPRIGLDFHGRGGKNFGQEPAALRGDRFHGLAMAWESQAS